MQREVIGGREMYEPVCRTCYHEQLAAQKQFDSGKQVEADRTPAPLKRVHSIENNADPADKKRLLEA